ncbi:conserved hypothetical protein [gamma proteobacterium HdN1]|nr:conserved hypothetical protein [gamma proteobacterium HdN1]
MVTSIIGGEWNPREALPKEFIALPQQIYAQDPSWLGEDASALGHQFSEANPWFSGGRAWLGVIPEQARLAGFYCGQLVEGEPAAFFGFWEGIDELSAHAALFSEFKTWAVNQGAKRVYGPINFTTFGAYRIRLDSFESGAFPSEPWNPPYYSMLLRKLGLSEHYRYLSTFNDAKETAQAVAADYLRVKPKLEKVVKLEAMTPDFWMSNLDALYGFVDEVFGANFAYTPIRKDAFISQCGEAFATRFCPHSSVLARTHDGRIAGFFLVYPDYSPLIRMASRDHIAASTLRYDLHYAVLPKPRLALAKTGGVHPDFRALGLFTAMGCELTLRAEPFYERISGALVREDNNSRQFALRHGVSEVRHYALFHQAL